MLNQAGTGCIVASKSGSIMYDAEYQRNEYQDWCHAAYAAHEL